VNCPQPTTIADAIIAVAFIAAFCVICWLGMRR
jgi:hypothetical protein